MSNVLVTTDCDPSCKWKIAARDLRSEHSAAVANLERAPYQGNEGDVRLTAEGYSGLEKIEDQYRGLALIEGVGRNCTKACAIEAYIEIVDGPQLEVSRFGEAVEVKIRNLEGE